MGENVDLTSPVPGKSGRLTCEALREVFEPFEAPETLGFPAFRHLLDRKVVLLRRMASLRAKVS